MERDWTNQQKLDRALDDLAYVRELIDRTRLRWAEGYQYLLLWGALWLVGYGSGIWLAPGEQGKLWLVLYAVGTIGSLLLGNADRTANGQQTTPLLLRKLGWVSGLLLLFGFAVLMLFRVTDERLINAFFPLWIGMIYIVNGIFLGREAIATGVWLLVVAVASLAVPSSLLMQNAWLACAGGGGLLVSGWLMRRQVMQHDR